MNTGFIYLVAAAIFIFGTIIGSFLNVVISRYQSGLGLGGRSKCFSCGATLAWYELIPLFSFVFQKGRCNSCRSTISWQYPIVELLTGVVFLALFVKFFIVGKVLGEVTRIGVFYFLYALFISGLAIVISAYDFRHQIIPNDFVYALNALAFMGLFAGMRFNMLSFITGAVFFLFFWVLWFVSHERWMGFGDATFALGLGWLLGPAQGIPALFLAFWSGTVIGLLLIGVSKIRALFLPRKSFTLKSEIPFGPFLAFGAFISFLFNLDINALAALLSFYV